MRKPERIKLTIEKLKADEEKYFNLVWYARRDGERLTMPELEGVVGVENEYPEEVENLMGEHSDWYHGFNSGMLAATRLYLEMIEGDPDYALEEFPHLDS